MTTARAPTRDEYAQAVFDAVQCIEARGLTASSVEQPDGSIAIQVTSSDEGPAAGEAIDAVYDECTEEYLNEIQSAYLVTIRPNENEAFEVTRACLADAGMVAVDASAEDVDAVVQANSNDTVVAECLSRPYLQPTVNE